MKIEGIQYKIYMQYKNINIIFQSFNRKMKAYPWFGVGGDRFICDIHSPMSY